MSNLAAVRAVRNNNPGNIRIGAPWQGLMPRGQMSPDQSAETAFCVFLSPQWGFRAMATIFHTYADKDGVKTLRQAVTRWAPPGENNTAAYVEHVCSLLSWSPDNPYPFHDAEHLAACCKAFSIHEVGVWAFEDADALAGVETAH